MINYTHNTHKTHIIRLQYARARKSDTKIFYNMEKYSETSEKAIETYLAKKTKEQGGICLKFSSLFQTGYPDRIVMLPYGLQAWVELKSKGKKPGPLQRIRHDELRAIGQPVYVIDSKQGVDDMMNELTEKNEA